MRLRLLLFAPWALLGFQAAAAASVREFSERCVQARQGGGTVRILHFGDSHLVPVAAQEGYGRFFRTTYGEGGAGFGLPWLRPRRGLQAQLSRGWRRETGLRGGGLAGGYLEARQDGEWARVEGSFSRLRIHFLRQAGGGRVQVRVDGLVVGEADLGREPGNLMREPGSLVLLERDLGPRAGTRRLEILVQGGGAVRILGLALEGPSGATHSVMAFNGAQASWMQELPEPLFLAQVRAEAPDLVVLAYGTNEANAPAFDPEAYRQRLEGLVRRFQRAAPGAALLLAGPPDARLPRARPRALAQVIEVQQAVAARYGGLFVDQQQAMGGGGAIQAWVQQGWASRDQVHLTAPGYDKLTQAVLGGLVQGMGQPQLMAALRPERTPARAGKGRGRSLPAPAAPERAQGNPLYTFRTADGKLFITDNPALVAGLAGEWVGRVP